MARLVGFVGPLGAAEARSIRDRMLREVEHESFYESGTASFDQPGMHVGWTGHGHVFPDGLALVVRGNRFTAVLVGQLVGPAPIKTQLDEAHRFFERLAHLTAHDLTAALKHVDALDGMCAGMVICHDSGRWGVFNDRLGMHRLFVHRAEHGTYFASEAKAILAVLPSAREFQLEGLGELALLGYTLGNQAPFKGIEILPAASFLHSPEQDRICVSPFFDHASWSHASASGDGGFEARYASAFPAAVEKSVSSGRTGLSLTGGLDSRMVLAAAGQVTGTLPCYTFGHASRETYDVSVSRQVARLSGQTHKVISLDDRCRHQLPDLLDRAVRLSDGYLGLSGAAELFANMEARTVAPIRITGNYGSEVLRGVRSLGTTADMFDIAEPDLQLAMKQASARLAAIASSLSPVEFAVCHQAPHHGYGRHAIESSQVVPRSPFLDSSLLPMCFRSAGRVDGNAIARAVIGAANPSLLSVPTDRGYLGRGDGLSSLVRRAWREATFKAEYLTGRRKPAVLFRSAHFRRTAERWLLGRHKFYHLGRWLREDLEDLVRATVIPPGALPMFQRRKLLSLVDDHFGGIGDHTEAIDLLLTLTITRSRLLTGG